MTRRPPLCQGPASRHLSTCCCSSLLLGTRRSALGVRGNTSDGCAHDSALPAQSAVQQRLNARIIPRTPSASVSNVRFRSDHHGIEYRNAIAPPRRQSEAVLRDLPVLEVEKAAEPSPRLELSPCDMLTRQEPLLSNLAGTTPEKLVLSYYAWRKPARCCRVESRRRAGQGQGASELCRYLTRLAIVGQLDSDGQIAPQEAVALPDPRRVALGRHWRDLLDSPS